MAYYLIFDTFKMDMNALYQTTTKVGVTFPVLVFASETSFRCNVVLFFTAVFFVSNQIKLSTFLDFILMSRYKPLHDAVRNNQRDLVTQLLNNGADVNAQDARGTTALHIAVESGNLPMVELLLKFGADTGIEGKYGNIALHVSSATGSSKITLTLLSNGNYVNRKNRYGESPLHIAVKYSNKDVVEILLNKNAQLNTQDFYGDTVLHSCVRENSKEILELLLEYGADVRTTNKEDYTAFDVALQRNEEDMIRVLFPHHIFGKNKIDNIEEFWTHIRAKTDRKKQLQEYWRELQSINQCKVCQSRYSFADFLLNNPRRIAKCVGNENFKETLESDECVKRFPSYNGMMRRNFERGVTRRLSLEKCYRKFSAEVNSQLPLLCLELIFEDFTIYELANFHVT